MWETLAAVVSAIIAIIALVASYFSWRRSELRRDDVLAWANEAIATLQSLVLICSLRTPLLNESFVSTKVLDLIFDTSILVERGRLFFKNEVIDEYGAEKPPAYRGYRPKILDHLVIAHRIACEWNSADDHKRLRLRAVADDCLKNFVSLAQQEVGRGRTASVTTAKGGDGSNLEFLLSEVSQERLAAFKMGQAG